jgi:hypothetical protein
MLWLSYGISTGPVNGARTSGEFADMILERTKTFDLISLDQAAPMQ